MNNDSGLFGGFFQDPQKAAALGMLMSALNPYGKDQTPAMMQMLALKGKQNEQKSDRAAMELALTQAGMDPAMAKQYASNPEAARIALEQKQLQGQRQADSDIMGGFGGQPSQPSQPPSGGMPPMMAPQAAATPTAAPAGSPQDRDLLIRTVIGEASNQGPEGMAAVAHVVNNRLSSGKYGQSMPDVLFAPKQFEPWNTRRSELMSISPDSKAYRDAAAVVDRVQAGEIPDATGGATHFANVPIVEQRGNAAGMRWINDMKNNGTAVQIGSHTFGRPDSRPGAVRTSASPVSDGGYNFLDAQADKPPVMAQGGDEKPIPAPLTSARSAGPTAEQIMGYIQKYPNASKETKAKLWDQYNKAVDDQKPTEGQKDYNAVYQQEKAAGRTPPTLKEWTLEKSKSGAQNITIDQKTETEFDKKAAGHQAERLTGYVKGGDTGKDNIADIGTLRQASRALGSQGVAAGIKERLGPYAESVGIPVEGLSDIQVFTSVVQKMAPQLRVEGSGSTSDIEFKGMLKAIGSLSNNPEAREKILDTFEASARNKIARADIASRILNKEITRTEGEKLLRDMPDPMTAFREWRDKNPDAYAAALSGKQSEAKPTAKMSPADIDQSLVNARAAIAAGKPRDAVIKKLRENGIDAGGL